MEDARWVENDARWANNGCRRGTAERSDAGEKSKRGSELTLQFLCVDDSETYT